MSKINGPLQINGPLHNDVPVTDKRDFKTQFLLKSGQLVPLFNLSTLLNSRSKKETIPFLSYFLPGKVDDDNSSYQVFLRFNFEFGKVKIKPKQKQKSIKTTEPTLEIKESEKVKETTKADDIEQTIDELLAADIEALAVLNQTADQNLSKEIKALDLKLESVDIENIKQPK